MIRKTTKEQDIFTLEERGTALLGLGLQDDDSDYEVVSPTDQDLEALLEDRLTPEQRASVLGALAHSPEDYQRWLSLVELKATLESDELALSGAAPEQSKPNRRLSTTISWYQKLFEWLPSSVIPIGAVAAGLVLTWLVFPVSQNMHKEVSALYRDYSQGAAQLLIASDNLPTRGLNTTSDASYSSDKTSIAQGILAGLSEIRSDAFINGIVVDKERFGDTSALGAKDADALFELGRLSVLTHAQCQRSDEQDYHLRAGDLFKKLATSTRPAAYPALRGLEALLVNMKPNSTSFSSSDTCAMALSLIGQFASE